MAAPTSASCCQLWILRPAVERPVEQHDVARRRRGRRSAPSRAARRDRSARRGADASRRTPCASSADARALDDVACCDRGSRPVRARRARGRSRRRPRESARACPASRARDAARLIQVARCGSHSAGIAGTTWLIGSDDSGRRPTSSLDRRRCSGSGSDRRRRRGGRAGTASCGARFRSAPDRTARSGSPRASPASAT